MDFLCLLIMHDRFLEDIIMGVKGGGGGWHITKLNFLISKLEIDLFHSGRSEKGVWHQLHTSKKECTSLTFGFLEITRNKGYGEKKAMSLSDIVMTSYKIKIRCDWQCHMT